VDFLRALLGDVISIAAYCALFAGIHKLFQIATTLGEIKEVLQGQRRAELMAPVSVPVGLALSHHPSDAGEDEAAAYAQNLLRAVNAERQVTEVSSKTV
jgi:hypothetical protein